MSGHIVVAFESCPLGHSPGFDMGGCPIRCDQAPEDGATRLRKCHGCLGDGTRALLDQAVPVERPQVYRAGDDGPVLQTSERWWREVSDD